MSRKVNIFNALSATPSCADPDVIAYFAKAEFSEVNLASYLASRGLTYIELQTIVCDFITGAKSDGWYSDIDNMYINIGDTSDQKKYNFIDPQDLDASGRLIFNGGWTFDDIGFNGNGINGYAQTNYIPSVKGTSSAQYFGIYNNTASPSGGNNIMGVFQPADTRRMWVNFGVSKNMMISNAVIDNYAANQVGYFHSRRSLASGPGANEGYINGTSIGTPLTSAYSPATVEFYLGAFNNNGVAQLFAPQVISFAIFAGAAFSDATVKQINSRVQTYLTSLGVI